MHLTTRSKLHCLCFKATIIICILQLYCLTKKPVLLRHVTRTPLVRSRQDVTSVQSPHCVPEQTLWTALFGNNCIPFHVFTLTRRMTVWWRVARKTVIRYASSKSTNPKLLGWKWETFILNSRTFFCVSNTATLINFLDVTHERRLLALTRKSLGSTVSTLPNQCD